MPGVAGVVGRYEGSFAVPGDESPAQACPEVVVICAERVEFVEAGVAGVLPVEAVVVFDPSAGAAFDRAAGAGPREGNALGGGGPAPEMGHVAHVDPAGDDQLQHCVTE
jgi:hypothetical protein